MLRASVEAKQGRVDLRAISEGAKDDTAGVAHAAELTAFAEAAVRGDPAAIASARAALRARAGSETVVDAAGVIANFERMTRIADATGIPLDDAPRLAAHDFVASLGLDAYASARNTAPLSVWRRAVAPLLAPAAKKVMARFMRR
jgi:hypothetical protein